MKANERRAAKMKSIPLWYNRGMVKKVYQKAKELNLTVDHVVPIQSSLVCGLHCWHNLQLLDQSANSSKGNHYWPDMP
jgi:5-methylcytosine-specific restriction endonuclease McrA